MESKFLKYLEDEKYERMSIFNQSFRELKQFDDNIS